MRLAPGLGLLVGVIVGSTTAGCETNKAAHSPRASQAATPPSVDPVAVIRQPDAGASVRDAAPVHSIVPAPDELVDLQEILPKVALDMRYAGSNNFVGKAMYPKARCLVRGQVALALAKVQVALQKDGLQLLLWDCYRPFSVQEAFWKLVPDSRYVAQPVRQDGKLAKGSKHNRGAAVDLTLLTLSGRAVLMPTDHDDFSERAHVDAKGIPAAAHDNANKLRESMQAAGFSGIATEWWHFDHESWRNYELSDQPL